MTHSDDAGDDAGDDVRLRPASAADLPAIADVYLAARERAVPAMPPPVHSPDEVRRFVLSWDLTEPGRELWLAEAGAGDVVGFTEVKDDWLDDLYVHPKAAGTGIGTSLLDVAKSLRPEGFCLWVFESNLPAREFYERRGMVRLERTDGSANEEGCPEVKMAWPGAEPLAFYRGLIDDVDTQLAELLARRAALTRAVQTHKAADGLALRDHEREAQIAAAMALRAPELGEERLRRIVHAIVTESLDAADS